MPATLTYADGKPVELFDRVELVLDLVPGIAQRLPGTITGFGPQPGPVRVGAQSPDGVWFTINADISICTLVQRSDTCA